MSAPEVIYRNQLSSLLLRQGWNVFLPVHDDGIDLIAHHRARDDIRLIQPKSRWCIDRKYIGRGIWIAFPHGPHWYLARHRDMIAMADVAGYTASRSWTEGGAYTVGSLTAFLQRSHRDHLIGTATIDTTIDAIDLTPAAIPP